MTDAPADAPTPFHDLAAFTALPRCAGLVLSPDGSRLVTAVSTPDADGTRYRTALWEVDPAGARPARPLTRGDPGEHDPVFTPGGDLLFLSARPAPGTSGDDPPAALWCLPATGGEARPAGTRPGGLAGPVVARDAGTVVATSATLPGAGTADDDAARRAARATAKVTAILHEGAPVRFWDHDLGPDRPRLLAASPADENPIWTDLTPTAGAALEQAAFDVTPDGSTVLTTWRVDEPYGASRRALVALDVPTDTHPAAHRVLLDDPDHTVDGPVAVSPDGRWVACLRTRRTSAIEPPDVRCVVVARRRRRTARRRAGLGPLGHRPRVDARLRGPRRDRRRHRPRAAAPHRPRHRDRRPAHRRRRRLLRPGGRTGRRRVRAAQRRRRPARPGPARSRGPGAPIPDTPAPAGPGTPAAGHPHRGHGHGRGRHGTCGPGSCCPTARRPTAPAPLLLWIHGGPLSSWNGWHWRWNPWVMAAHGYAVLLPDPALSTGYGRAFVTRGWGRWGAEPYTDVLALTDAAERLPEIDAGRTAAMGGSFGGYLANWVAGHTDRFTAVVTHASLWALDQFVPTTDDPDYWRRELTPQVRAEYSPHRHADAIRTPMLVIHGDRDHRVPIGEALRLWSDLMARCSDQVPHKFLYFPDENHWVLRPSHVRLWYATVLAFLAHH